jgi:hypothetical protein
MCAGSLPPLANGFGADGPAAVVVDTVPRTFPFHRDAHIYRPKEIAGRIPVIFVFPGFGAWYPAYYDHLLRHLASRGYCVVFCRYMIAQFPRQDRTYRMLFTCAFEAVRHRGGYMDTTRIGMVGHSFGASALPAFGWRCIKKKHWGSNGAFMMVMAPHFVMATRHGVLDSFPPQTRLLVQVYEEDDCNDHRMAKDIFESIHIPFENKDYMVLRSDTCPVSGYRQAASHSAPFNEADEDGAVDGVDYYGIYRHLDALAALTFTGDTLAGKIALGNGAPEQLYMGTWPDGSFVRPCIVSDSAPLIHPQEYHFFRWGEPWNLRRRHNNILLNDPFEPVDTTRR